MKNGLIKNEEEFILAYDEAGTFRINLTQYSEEEVKCWQFDINSALYLVNLKKDRKYFKYISSIYLIIAIYLYFNNSDTTEMHIFSETTNELLGVLLCALWIFFLPLLNINLNHDSN